jgi:hypothetical protein
MFLDSGVGDLAPALFWFFMIFMGGLGIFCFVAEYKIAQTKKRGIARRKRIVSRQRNEYEQRKLSVGTITILFAFIAIKKGQATRCDHRVGKTT